MIVFWTWGVQKTNLDLLRKVVFCNLNFQKIFNLWKLGQAFSACPPFSSHKNKLALLFRGCESFKDILEDISAWQWLSKTISRDAQYVTLRKYFSHPSLVMYSFATPPIKLKSGTANRWGTTNNKPHGPMIMMGQLETPSNSYIKFITLFSAGAQCCCASYQVCNYVEPNPFSWVKLVQVGFPSSIYCAGLHTGSFKDSFTNCKAPNEKQNGC
jgi:hypothetical protein